MAVSVEHWGEKKQAICTVREENNERAREKKEFEGGPEKRDAMQGTFISLSLCLVVLQGVAGLTVVAVLERANGCLVLLEDTVRLDHADGIRGILAQRGGLALSLFKLTRDKQLVE